MLTTTRRLALAGATLLLAGCGAGQDSTQATHTMPDGTVMEGETHIHDGSHSHGGEPGAGPGPSAAASMVCAGSVVDDVTRIMGLASKPEPASSWRSPMFTCTFDLDQGPLVLTVHDVEDEAAGLAWFQEQRTGDPGAKPIKGVYSLGLPAYETGRGTVSFVRDGKTLVVDAAALPDREDLGGQSDMSRSEIAYAVATSVLACWTEHA